ncbi:MAG: bifunctional 4-hydroxy-3-methylbut-2-enyl diphosphate reductase/30S ribosomal protein S1 [Bacillota bacterium]
MRILVAENGGFCFGVRNAVESIEERMGMGRDIYTLGPVIHNPQVVEDLSKRGAYPVDTVEDIPHGAIAVIRSHGVGPEVYEKCLTRGLEVVDATCPFVKRIHDTVKEHHEKGYTIVIVGKSNHPEVKGINGWCGKQAIIISTTEEAHALPQLSNVCIVAQTTVSPACFEDILGIIRPKIVNAKVYNTICSTTGRRQKEAIEIATKSDIVIVIGGHNSSNTRELYNLCRTYCRHVYSVEKAADVACISLEIIGSDDIIGVVAGASTPDWMIREVVGIMSDLNLADFQSADKSEAQTAETVQETPGFDTGPAHIADSDSVQIPEEEVSQESAPDVAVDAQEPDTKNAAKDAAAQENNMFLEGIEKTLVRIRPGQVIKGTVVQVSDDEVCVNIGYKSDGFIRRNELSTDPDENPADILKPGDEIDVEVLKVNDGDSTVLLSRRRVLEKKFWEQLIVDKENNVEFQGVCKEVVKGGVIASINGIRTFVPASHLSLKYVENLEDYVGTTLRLRIIEVDKYKRRVVASQKMILQEESRTKKKQLWESLAPGQTIHGVVRRITDFGAFVDIGGIDGLLHVTDLSWHRVRHPSDIVSIGEEIDVQVLSVDPEKERVSLGLKQLRPDPWTLTAQKYAPGSIIEGKVVRIVNFGAFVAVEPGIDGLIHISQVSTHRINKVEDELSVGDIVRVKVLEVDPQAKRISLSRKQVLLEEQAAEDSLHGDDVAGFDSMDIDIPPIQQSSVTIGDMFPDLVADDSEE